MIMYTVPGVIMESDRNDFFCGGRPSVTISQIGSPDAVHEAIPYGQDFVIEKSLEEDFFDVTVNKFDRESILRALAVINDCRSSEIIVFEVAVRVAA